MERIAVVGSGSWGTTFAALCTRNAETVLWGRDPELVSAMVRTRRNPRYLPATVLPDALCLTDDLAAACRDATVVVMAVPSHGFRDVLASAAPFIGRDAVVVSLTKGIERRTLCRMTEVTRAVLGSSPEHVAVLTGPTLAREVAEGQPTASVVASVDDAIAQRLQALFMTPTFRVYTNPDVIGCEVAGAMKNVLAIAVGAAAGLGFGDNARAALITRGLAELTRLGVAMGGDPLTFAGLAGMGDLVATCTSQQSRNRHVGVELGRGRPLDAILAETSMVAEGVRTTGAVLELGRRHDVDLPIAQLVGAVISDGRRPRDLIAELMMREAKPELHGIR